MGEVWRATDTKLGREVAIKVLPDAFAADPDRMARFQREAQVLASLNHPNIAAIYGLVGEGGARPETCIVMELVDGPTLADRIAQGPIPLDEALPIARQIAEALEYAHDKGIIHRDLKPANIKLTSDGRVKVLDFGLAKALSSDSPPGNPASSPTLTMRATLAGVILGTAAYMSPEQAKGKPVDRRADIWAFGVVLVEMLTGCQMYTGETASETLAAVIMKDPDLAALPASTPGALRHLLRRCLDKDPLRRLRDIGEARIVLERAPLAEEADAARRLPVAATHRGVPVWVAALLAVPALTFAAFLWRTTRPADRPMLRFTLDLGPDAVSNRDSSVAISPDGRRLVYPVRSGNTTVLAVLPLDRAKANILAGTEDAVQPFFSPDSQWIGFFADQKLKKISVEGGAAVTICETNAGPRGAWWADDGSIIANLDNLRLVRVPAGGGQPQIVAKPEEHGERTWRWPQVLPGGETVLVTGASGTGAGYEDANIEVVSLKTGQPKVVQRGGYFGRYLPSGHLIYLHQGTLFAVPFDLSTLETRGTPAPIIEEVAGIAPVGAGRLYFSRAGTMVCMIGKSVATSTLPTVWLDASGNTQPLLKAAVTAVTPKLSPDGRRLAVAITGDISVYDPQRGATTRLTFRPDAINRFPLWMPDGKHIVFGQTVPTPDFGIWWIRADGSGQPEKLFGDRDNLIPLSISPDGRRLAFARRDPGTDMDIWTLPLDTSDPDHPKAGQPEPFVRDPRTQWQAAFSPDGRWLAYESDESGTPQIFVRPFPGGPAAGKWQISNGPAAFPLWSRNGQELFYLSTGGQIMVTRYTARAGAFSADKPRQWSPVMVEFTGNNIPWDLAPEGKRFVVFPHRHPAEGGDPETQTRATVFLNFFDELTRRMPPK